MANIFFQQLFLQTSQVHAPWTELLVLSCLWISLQITLENEFILNDGVDNQIPKNLNTGLVFVTSEKRQPEPKASENFQYL